jgi:hypothetical protein
MKKDNILKVILKHHIYEACINVCFNHIIKNFNSDKKRIPAPGEVFVSIQDKENEDIYFNCKIIDKKDLEEYDAFVEFQKRNFAFAFEFDRSEYEGEVISENGQEYFTYRDMEFLVFEQ